MKRDEIAMCVFGAVVLLATLAALVAPAIFVSHQQAELDTCGHAWGKWGDIVDNGSHSFGPRWQQTRVCEKCGLGQVREAEWIHSR